MFKAPRGTQDILPEDQNHWRVVEAKATEVCRLFQYKRIDTPIFEQTELFLRGVGEGTDIVEKQMYTFEDRGGDRITLRPEGTAPICRAYIEHGMHNQPQPVRLYYTGPIFRYERPQKGRMRQHHQFGVEAIGSSDPVFDAQVIDLAWRFYRSLGLKGLTLQLNSIGCSDCRPDYLAALGYYYSDHVNNLCPDCSMRRLRSPLRLLDCKNASCQDTVTGAPRILDYLCQPCGSHFEELKGYLDKRRIGYELNPYLVRGLDYYTRTVFEIQPAEVRGQSAIGGGGRYDNLIEQLGGRPTPAVGFATGLERIIMNLQNQGIRSEDVWVGRKVFVVYADEAGKREVLAIAATLQDNNISATFTSGDYSLKSQMRQAGSSGSPWVIVVGQDEVSKDSVVLRNMAKGTQEETSLGNAIKQIGRQRPSDWPVDR
ncbi:MAG: histidine--tRNA ligase [Chloroflexi bacterium RBG_13_53_26]|nr:MAG: histidine--tRNA ligase [Chloroflexi bacterium RBG_13_53_26]